MKKSSNKGFTLVELIIVIAILAIIMLIAIPNFSGIQQRMQVRADKQTAAQIGKAIRIWYAERVSEGLSVDSLYTFGIDEDTGKATGDMFKGAVKLGDTGAPTKVLVSYDQLEGMADYMSITNKPTSLSDVNGAKVDKQMYAPILAGQGRTAKIFVIIQKAAGYVSDGDNSNGDETENNSTVSDADSAGWAPAADDVVADYKANYNGESAGIAYIEP